MKKYRNLLIRDPNESNRIIYYVKEGERDIEKYRQYEREGYTLELTNYTYTYKWGKYWETGNGEEEY